MSLVIRQVPCVYSIKGDSMGHGAFQVQLNKVSAQENQHHFVSFWYIHACSI